MKIDATCKDANGVEATVTVDLDYVSDEDEAREWIIEELYSWSLKNAKSFDTAKFEVANWNDIAQEIRATYS